MTEDISAILAQARAATEAAAEKARLEAEQQAEEAPTVEEVPASEAEEAPATKVEAVPDTESKKEEKNNSEIFRQNLAEYNDLSKKLNQLLSIAQSFKETLPALEKRKEEIENIPALRNKIKEKEKTIEDLKKAKVALEDIPSEKALLEKIRISLTELESELTELESTLTDLEKQQAELPEIEDAIERIQEVDRDFIYNPEVEEKDRITIQERMQQLLDEINQIPKEQMEELITETAVNEQDKKKRLKKFEEKGYFQPDIHTELEEIEESNRNLEEWVIKDGFSTHKCSQLWHNIGRELAIFNSDNEHKSNEIFLSDFHKGHLLRIFKQKTFSSFTEFTSDPEVKKNIDDIIESFERRIQLARDRNNVYSFESTTLVQMVEVVEGQASKKDSSISIEDLEKFKKNPTYEHYIAIVEEEDLKTLPIRREAMSRILQEYLRVEFEGRVSSESFIRQLESSSEEQLFAEVRPIESYGKSIYEDAGHRRMIGDAIKHYRLFVKKFKELHSKHLERKEEERKKKEEIRKIAEEKMEKLRLESEKQKNTKEVTEKVQGYYLKKIRPISSEASDEVRKFKSKADYPESAINWLFVNRQTITEQTVELNGKSRNLARLISDITEFKKDEIIDSIRKELDDREAKAKNSWNPLHESVASIEAKRKALEEFAEKVELIFIRLNYNRDIIGKINESQANLAYIAGAARNILSNIEEVNNSTDEQINSEIDKLKAVNSDSSAVIPDTSDISPNIKKYQFTTIRNIASFIELQSIVSENGSIPDEESDDLKFAKERAVKGSEALVDFKNKTIEYIIALQSIITDTLGNREIPGSLREMLERLQKIISG